MKRLDLKLKSWSAKDKLYCPECKTLLKFEERRYTCPKCNEKVNVSVTFI